MVTQIPVRYVVRLTLEVETTVEEWIKVASIPRKITFPYVSFKLSYNSVLSF